MPELCSWITIYSLYNIPTSISVVLESAIYVFISMHDNSLHAFYVLHDSNIWGRVRHICVNKRATIGPDNGLSSGRRQDIIWTNAEILFIEPLGTNFSKIAIQTFSFEKVHLKSLRKLRPFSFCLNVILSGCQKYLYTESMHIFVKMGGF